MRAAEGPLGIEGETMRRATRHVTLGALLLTIMFTASACGPEAYEAWSRIFTEVAGGMAVIAIALLVILGSIPPS